MESSWITVFLVALWTWEVVKALPTGAPSTACISMYPQHPGPNGPVSAQPSLVVPFRIDVAAVDNGRQYKINVVRNSNFPGQPPLLGFFIQVRDPVSDTPLGEFVQLPPYARFGDCGGNSTVTHQNRQEKPIDQTLEFYWAPNNLPLNTKNLQVLGTFVQNMQTFWVKVPSQIFTGTLPAAPATNANLQEAPVVQVDSVANPSPSAINNANLNTPVTSPNDRRPGFGNSALAGSGMVTANDGTQQSSLNAAHDQNAARQNFRVVNSATSTFSFLLSTLLFSIMALLL